MQERTLPQVGPEFYFPVLPKKRNKIKKSTHFIYWLDLQFSVILYCVWLSFGNQSYSHFPSRANNTMSPRKVSYEKYSIDKIDVSCVSWWQSGQMNCRQRHRMRPGKKKKGRENQWRNPGCWSFPTCTRWFTKKFSIPKLTRVCKWIILAFIPSS